MKYGTLLALRAFCLAAPAVQIGTNVRYVFGINANVLDMARCTHKLKFINK